MAFLEMRHYLEPQNIAKITLTEILADRHEIWLHFMGMTLKIVPPVQMRALANISYLKASCLLLKIK